MVSLIQPLRPAASLQLASWLTFLNRLHQATTGCLVLLVVIALCYDSALTPVVLQWSQLALLACLMLSSAINDLCTRHIPNQLTYTSLGAACFLLLLSAVLQFDQLNTTHPVVDAGIAILVSAMLMLAGWLDKSVGGGDVKLVIAAAALLGLFDVLTALFIAHLMASVLLGLFLLKSKMRQLVDQLRHSPTPSAVISPYRRNTRIPMAGFYALATALTLCL